MAKPSAQRSDNPLKFITSQWKKLSLSAAFIMGSIGSFWVNPPYTPGSSKAETLTHFARFVVAIVVGLMVLPIINKSDKKAHALFWGKIAAATLIISVAVFFVYQKRFGEWTLYHTVRQNDKDEKKLLVIGSKNDIRDDVKEFVRENPSLSNRELLQNAAWKPSYIWKEEAILHRRLILSAMYVIFTPLFAIVMVAVAQVMNCAMSKE